MNDKIVPSPDDTGSRRYRWTALLILGAGYGANHMDRNLLSILIDPISREFHLSDTQIGLLSGVGFAVFYAIFGIPLARLADAHNRRRLVVATQTAFSLFTMLSGMTQNFIQLFLARIGIAIGESGATPPALSMLSDLYPVHQRGRVMAVYTTFAYLGFLCGFLFGGMIAHAFGWRYAFFAAAVPGLVFSLATILFLHEPVRRSSEGKADLAEAPLGMKETVRFLLSQRAFIHLVVGASIAAACVNALTLWLPVLLIRSFGLSLLQVGTALALAFGIAGGLGTLLIGVIVDHFGKRDIRAYFWTIGVTTFIVGPTVVLMLFTYDVALFLALMLIPAGLCGSYAGPAMAMVQTLAPPRMRGVATSIYMFGVSLFGIAFGTQLVGILSDTLMPHVGKESLRWALLSMSVIPIWSAVHFYIGARHLQRDLDRTRSFVEGETSKLIDPAHVGDAVGKAG